MIKVPTKRPPKRFLTVQELAHATETLFRKAQSEGFPDEVVALMNNKLVPKSSKLLELNPQIERSKDGKFTDGVMRSFSRIWRAPGVPYETKRPAILPSDHIVTRLYVQYYHEKLHHVGEKTIIAALRERVCILNASMERSKRETSRGGT